MAKTAEKSKEKTVSEAKNTVPEGQETPPEVDTNTVSGVEETPPEAQAPASGTVPDESPETPPEAQETQIQYAFPKVSACPRCHATDTLQTSTQENVQYRQCQRPICRETFKVIGQEIVFTDNKQGG